MPTPTYFTGGWSKDDIDIPSWLWKNARASQAKNDITNAFAAAYIKDDDEIDRLLRPERGTADGNDAVGFWFLKQRGRPDRSAAPERSAARIASATSSS